MRGFGYKTGWLAIRDVSARETLRALGCQGVGPIGWDDGVRRAYAEDGVLVATPPLGDGWTLVMGRWVASRADLDVAQLSTTFDREVQLFVSHRVVDLHRWDRAIDGVLIRSFEYLGEKGRVTRWHGEPDEPEDSVGVSSAAHLAGQVTVAEDDVMRVAGDWSVDPTSLEGLAATGPMQVGRIGPQPRLKEPIRYAQVVSVTDLIMDSSLSIDELNERIEERADTAELLRLRPHRFQ
jgi:hypothetical protein